MFATRQIILFFIDNAIEMPLIRIVLLFLVVGGLALFALSNLSPVLAVVFLGMQSQTLPLATWMGIAVAAGALTSFCLQFLSYLQRTSSNQRIEEFEEVPSPTRSFRRQTYENPPTQNQTPYTPPPPPPPPPETPKTTVGSDWEERIGEDWDFDETASTSKRPDFDRSQGNVQSHSTNPEIKQDPKAGSQTNSVYSFSYREQNQTGVGKADAIYDANYRVITPPYQKPVESADDDEDWGFEDDDDFNDESESSAKRR